MDRREQGIITSAEDLGRLRIVDFQRCNGLWDNNPAVALRVAANCL